MLIDREAVDRENKRLTTRLSHPLLPPVETQLLSLAPVAPSSWHSKSNCYDPSSHHTMGKSSIWYTPLLPQQATRSSYSTAFVFQIQSNHGRPAKISDVPGDRKQNLQNLSLLGWKWNPADSWEATPGSHLPTFGDRGRRWIHRYVDNGVRRTLVWSRSSPRKKKAPKGLVACFNQIERIWWFAFTVETGTGAIMDVPALVTRFPDSVFDACLCWPAFPLVPPLAPPAPLRRAPMQIVPQWAVPLCSPVSQLSWRGPTSRARAISLTFRSWFPCNLRNRRQAALGPNRGAEWSAWASRAAGISNTAARNKLH